MAEVKHRREIFYVLFFGENYKKILKNFNLLTRKTHPKCFTYRRYIFKNKKIFKIP